MPQENSATLALNRGLLSALGLARVDLTRYRMAARVMTNWMARVLGSMMLRPGRAYIGHSLGDAVCRALPFVYGALDTARVEITAGALRVWVNDELVSRPAVTTAVTNGDFAADLSGWTDSSDAGATVTWLSAGEVSFVGTGTNNAVLDQNVAVPAGSQGVRHALRINVLSGPFTFLCGTVQGDDSYIESTTLNTGVHSLAFTPGANFWLRFENPNAFEAILGTVEVEAAGVMQLPAPWAAADLPSIRYAQSADVIFVACSGGPGGSGYQQMQIERRATDAWSIVQYPATTGPFRDLNITNITLTPSGITGDITLTASRPFFKSGQLGALFALVSSGQQVESNLAAASQYTNPVLVTGTGAQRALAVNITGTFVGTLTLQYAFAQAGPWIDTTEVWTAPVTTTYNDANNNQSIYYRLGFDPSDYTSGSATCNLSIASGSITGICRVTGVTDSQHVDAQVLLPLGGTAASTNWYEGAWSTFRGFPGTVKLFQGRLWWFGVSLFGSASDDYNNFDTVTELAVIGDAGPIIGQLDDGPIDNIYWALGLQQLVLGTATAETSCRSDYLGDPITPTNFNVIQGSTQGSAPVDAIAKDRSGIFVQVTGQRIFQLNLDIYTYSYQSVELTLLVPDLCAAGVLQLALQNKPDRRLHCRRGDGTVAIMVWDEAENVQCWLEIVPAASGRIIDISILPGAGQSEDQVYYSVQYPNGQVLHEKWALEVECTGLPVAKHLDAHVLYQGSATTTLAAIAPHLAGQTVSVWGWNTASPYTDAKGNQPGLDLGTYVVAEDGSVTGLNLRGTAYPVTNAVVGLPYTAPWESMKQAFAAALGTPLNQLKRINKLGLVLQNTHARGLQYGNDFEHLDDLPQSTLPQVMKGWTADTTLINAGGTTSVDYEAPMPDLDAILNDYDQPMSASNDIWSTDSRVCLQAASPRPCTVLAFTAQMQTSG